MGPMFVPVSSTGPISGSSMGPNSGSPMGPISGSSTGPISGPTTPSPIPASSMGPFPVSSTGPFPVSSMGPISGSPTVPILGPTPSPLSGASVGPAPGSSTETISGPTPLPMPGSTLGPVSGSLMGLFSGPTLASLPGLSMGPMTGSSMGPVSGSGPPTIPVDPTNIAFPVLLINECIAAIDIAPSSTTLIAGDTTSAIPVGYTETCEIFSIASPGIWYRVCGTGGMMTANTCATTSGMDTVISVYGEHACGVNRVCIGSNNDRPSDVAAQCPFGLASFVTWQSQENFVYHIRVGGHSTVQGTFHLQVSSPTQSSVGCLGSATTTAPVEPTTAPVEPTTTPVPPSLAPSWIPSSQPNRLPSSQPSIVPTKLPFPSAAPSIVPTKLPFPSTVPSKSPSDEPSTRQPSLRPSPAPSAALQSFDLKTTSSTAPVLPTPASLLPTPAPVAPTTAPVPPSLAPSLNPSSQPNRLPSSQPSVVPTKLPFPSTVPSIVPTKLPFPSTAPSKSPSDEPSTRQPSLRPSAAPSAAFQTFDLKNTSSVNFHGNGWVNTHCSSNSGAIGTCGTKKCCNFETGELKAPSVSRDIPMWTKSTYRSNGDLDLRCPKFLLDDEIEQRWFDQTFSMANWVTSSASISVSIRTGYTATIELNGKIMKSLPSADKHKLFTFTLTAGAKLPGSAGTLSFNNDINTIRVKATNMCDVGYVSITQLSITARYVLLFCEEGK